MWSRRQATRRHIDPSGFGYPGPTEQRSPDKAALRAQLAATARLYAPVTRLPTVIELRCPKCRHTGKVAVPDGHCRRFRCNRCGTSLSG